MMTMRIARRRRRRRSRCEKEKEEEAPPLAMLLGDWCV
jgi:hypothetical protein